VNNKIKVLIALLALVIFLTVFHFYRQKDIDTERHSALDKITTYDIITNYTEPVIISYLYLSQLNDLLETKDQKQIKAFINAGRLYISQTNSSNQKQL
jgi:SNF family Na+-dependent transporter